jgi:pimeloyl-ACP methyl ester carboxylesterase
MKAALPAWFLRPKALLIVLLLFIAGFLLSRWEMFRIYDEKAREVFKQSSLQPTFHYFRSQKGKSFERRMHFAEIGADTLPLVVFVHGSPGSWNAFLSYFKDTSLLKAAHLMAVDRPGYGYSGFGKFEGSAQHQAALLADVLQLNKNRRRPILVGHSLGGPIIARLAMDYPHLIGGLILIAPSIDPALEGKEYYREVLRFPVIQAFLPPEFDVSNLEIMSFKKELRKMLSLWKNICVPVTVIQGEKDDLVDPRNADFAVKMLINADTVNVIRLKDANHFIPWSHPDIVRAAILKHLED